MNNDERMATPTAFMDYPFDGFTLGYGYDWGIEELVEYEETIAEGTGHVGRSALIGMVARKPV